jgi:hypothetical protein
LTPRISRRTRDLSKPGGHLFTGPRAASGVSLFWTPKEPFVHVLWDYQTKQLVVGGAANTSLASAAVTACGQGPVKPRLDLPRNK